MVPSGVAGIGSLHLPSSARLQPARHTRPIKPLGHLRCTALVQATVLGQQTTFKRKKGPATELPEGRMQGPLARQSLHPICLTRLTSWPPQMLSGWLYLCDDGVQAVGPPGVVHWVRVQDAPGGERPGQGAQGGRGRAPVPYSPGTKAQAGYSGRGDDTIHELLDDPVGEMVSQGPAVVST